jgi:hypothetical protein
MHFLFNLLRINGLYMFRALLAHPQESLHNRHLVYCVRVVSWLHQVWSGTTLILNKWNKRCITLVSLYWLSFFLGVGLFANFNYTTPRLGSDCQHFDIHIPRRTFTPLKMRPFRWPETSVNKYAVTWRHVPKYRKPRTKVCGRFNK